MKLWSLLAAGGLYLLTAFDLRVSRKFWTALAFVGYSFSNFCFAMAFVTDE